MDNEQGSPDDYWESALFAHPLSGNAQDPVEVPTSHWRPSRGPGQFIGIGLAAFCFLVACVAVFVAMNTTGLLRLFWLVAAFDGIAATTVLAVMVARLRSITYVLTGSHLVVQRLGARIAIRIEDIAGVVFQPRDVIVRRGYERFWPGFYDSTIVTNDGPWRSIATAPAHERVRIRTLQGGTIAISPDRPVFFVETLDAMRQHRPVSIPIGSVGDDFPLRSTASPRVDPVPERRTEAPIPATPQRASQGLAEDGTALGILRHRIVQGDLVASRLLALSILMLIVSLFIAAWKSDSVARPVAVRWNPDGDPTWYVRPDGFWLIDGIWIFPATGAAILAINTALAIFVAALGRTIEVRLLLATAFVVGFLLLVGLARATGLV